MPAESNMARRYRDDEIARMLSKLGRQTGKGNRWTRSHVAFVRKTYGIDPPDEATRHTSPLTLAQATQHSGITDSTLLRPIQVNILAAEQITPYVPLKTKRADLDSVTASKIPKRLKVTAKPTLEGEMLTNQQSLYNKINSLHNGVVIYQ